MEKTDYTSSIHHDGSARYVKPLKPGALHFGDSVRLRLRASIDAPIQRVLLRTAPNGEQQFDEMTPAPSARSGFCRWWEVTLRMSMPTVHYRFLLFTDDGAWWYNGTGLHRDLPTDAEDFRLLADYAAPDWVRSSVFYQIFPDRFANGDPENDVREGEFSYFGFDSRKSPWGRQPLTGGGEAMVEFFGGDLLGIQNRLDYLEDLGANALYLNPVFTALSNHRYDVIDYENVDPHLGGNQALINLRTATRARKMRMILDIVPNHCGVLHPWFQRAFKDPQTPEAEFFTFHRHPAEYECWLGVSSLPKFNYRCQRLQEAMYAGEEAVFRRWLRPPFEIDGWRLDVANMLGRQGPNQLGLEVGRGIRQAIKAENPEAYVLGENFFDATPQLQGDNWDAVMNYMGFSKPLIYWLAGFYINQHQEPRRVASQQPWPTQALLDSWQSYRAAVPWVIARQQFNLLGSHDTPRILSVVKGSHPLAELAAGLLMTYVGVPSVYYGDEVGLAGDTRATMPWDPEDWDVALRAFYQKLIAFRKSSKALQEGGFQALAAGEDWLAFLRDTDEEQVIVVGNRGCEILSNVPVPVADGAIADGTVFTEVLSGGRVMVNAGHLMVPSLPQGIQIWQHRI